MPPFLFFLCLLFLIFSTSFLLPSPFFYSIFLLPSRPFFICILSLYIFQLPPASFPFFLHLSLSSLFSWPPIPYFSPFLPASFSILYLPPIPLYLPLSSSILSLSSFILLCHRFLRLLFLIFSHFPPSSFSIHFFPFSCLLSLSLSAFYAFISSTFLLLFLP